MEKKSRDTSILSITVFIIVISLIYSVQNMISPNLERISNYFGFGGKKAPLGILTFAFTILSGISIVFFGYLADKIIRKRLVFI